LLAILPSLSPLSYCLRGKEEGCYLFRTVKEGYGAYGHHREVSLVDPTAKA
jgi:hypothetical protein